MSLDDDNLIDDSVQQPTVEATVDATENSSEIDVTAEAPLDIKIPAANWAVAGPRVWMALMQILTSKKTVGDEGHKIEVNHDVMQQVNDTIAEVNQ